MWAKTFSFCVPVIVYSQISNLVYVQMIIFSYLHQQIWICIWMQILKKKRKTKLNHYQKKADELRDCIAAASFALHMECLPAFNQNLLKHDWSILLELQTD